MANGDKFKGPYATSGQTEMVGTSLNVVLDFRPIKVEIWNATTSDLFIYYRSMPSDSVANTTAGTGFPVNGIILGSNGFTIGSNVAAPGDILYWVATHEINL